MDLLQIEQDRRWNLDLFNIVSENKDLIFTDIKTDQQQIKNVMLVTLPLEITDALFTKLETTTQDQETTVWQEGRRTIEHLSAFSEGQSKVPGKWTFDLDRGTAGSTDVDFLWKQENGINRYLVPKNGAKLAIIGLRDIDSVTREDLVRLEYSSEIINGSNNNDNRIPEGSVVGYITSQRRYGKFVIIEYGYDLKIHWVTYPRSK